MEQNANAVDTTPVAASQEPVTQAPAAEASPAPVETSVASTPEVTFDEATQKYLDNQNIKGTPTEMIAELVKRNQAIRNQPKTEAVAEVLKQEPEVASTPAPKSTLSDMDIMTTQMVVERQYPDVKVNADFYKEMIANGMNPMNGNEIAVQRVLNFAAYKQKLADAEKAISAANTPAAMTSPSNQIEQNSAIPRVQTMDKLAAENIILFSAQEQKYGRPRHEQYDEAVKFLQDAERKK